MRPIVLTIAGSDPSGGAGIQADLRVFTALGVHGLSAITALTVQNSHGVRSVHPIAPEILAAQLEALFEDCRPKAVKIGMLGTRDQVRVVAEALRKFQPPNIVLDTVLASTGGVPLLDGAGRAAMVTELFPLSDLITPNIPEAEAFTGLSITDIAAMEIAGDALLALGARAALVKGGHLEGSACDVLRTNSLMDTAMSSPRLDMPHTHGTGCVLSSAIAGYLAQGMDLIDAVTDAKRLLHTALRMPIIIGNGRGYPDILAAAREGNILIHARRLGKLHGVYVVTDPDLRPDRTPEDIARAALAGGASVIQLRDKHASTSELIDLAIRLKPICLAAHALLIINDRVDVALAADTDGVHLGPDDMPPALARKILGPNRLIGASVSSVEEARPLAPYVSYFGVGAIYGTKTKLDAGAAVGTERILLIKAAFPNIPIVAIGGITVDNIREVVEAGADSAAIVSAVIRATDMTEATMALNKAFLKS